MNLVTRPQPVAFNPIVTYRYHVSVQISIPDELARLIDRVAIDRSAFVEEAIELLLSKSEPSPEAAAARKNVAEILSLGMQKREAYARLDELEQQLGTGGTFMVMLRVLFRSKTDHQIRTKITETVRSIHALRARMDELSSLLPPSKFNEVQHLWTYENTTSLSQQQERRKYELSHDASS